MPATTDIFRRYLHRVFIETGTYDGSGVLAALDAGYQEVYSIEAATDCYAACVERFTGDDRVHLFLGGSETELAHVLSLVGEPATVWLDAHSAFGNMLPDVMLYPLRQELIALAKAHLRTHTVLVDDVRILPDIGLTLDEARQALFDINPAYSVDLIDGNYYKKDILVATLLDPARVDHEG